MHEIDQAQFAFNEKAALVVAIMVAFLVFAISLDLTTQHFRDVAKKPKATIVGLIGQLLFLPAVAWAIGRYMVDTPSVAMGLLLVACCPSGALSNYLTSVAKGDVALSVTISAFTTVLSIPLTPIFFSFWASQNPAIKELIKKFHIEPKQVVVGLVIMLAVPVGAGMLVRAKRPALADKWRVWVRRAAILVFSVMVVMVLGSNMKILAKFAGESLLPVALAFAGSMLVGWAFAWIARVGAADRRAITFEIGLQNVAMALAISIALFPGLTGAAVACAMWGAVHVVGGLALAAAWSRIPVD